MGRLRDRWPASPPCPRGRSTIPMSWRSGPSKPRAVTPSSNTRSELAGSGRPARGDRPSLLGRDVNPRERVYVALGSNEGRPDRLSRARPRGDRQDSPDHRARRLLGRGDRARRPAAQGRYLNQMVLVETSLDPGRFLKVLHKIEDDERPGARRALGAEDPRSRHRAVRNPAAARSRHSSSRTPNSPIANGGSGRSRNWMSWFLSRRMTASPGRRRSAAPKYATWNPHA